MQEVVKKMVGRELSDYYPKKNGQIGEIVFEVEHLTSEKNDFKEITFNLRSGEILGFAGLMGAGRTEIMRAIFGLDKVASGSLKLNGQVIRKITPMVDPIPQFCVTRKCCSIAVPNVITRFPPIKRVNIKSESDGIKTACTPLFTPFNESGKMTRRKVSN